MKKLILSFATVVLLILGCTAGKDTTGMSPEEKFQVAKEKFENNDIEESLIDLQALLLQFSGTSITDDAQFYIGQCRFKKKEFILSAYEFSKLIKDFPTSQYVKDAQFMLSRAYFELSPHYSLDQKYTIKAIEEFQTFIDYFATDSRVHEAENYIKELNNKLSEKIFRSGIIYYRMDYSKAAAMYFDQLLEKYPDSKFVADALYYKIKILVGKGKSNEAQEIMNKFIAKYPNHSLMKEILELKNKF